MKKNLLYLIFDSCRFDTFMAAKKPYLDRLGAAEKRYSYASWTLPSHSALLTGVSAHSSPKKVFASEVYKKDFVQWSERLNIPDLSFKGFVPRLSLPAFLKTQGYRTHAYVSMPVLNQTTILNQWFDDYQLMPSHNDFSAMIDKITFSDQYPSFYLLNIGETHYPYTLPGESGADLPRIHGVHGVFKHLDDFLRSDFSETPEETIEEFFSEKALSLLKDKQQRNITYLDGLMERIYDLAPPNTHFIVTADHGECFGEDGYFGHGPVFHEKAFEVFLLEGSLSR
jgi:hypothetical protein